MADALTFVLVPDADAGRRLRRFLASRSARMGLRVGTWLELLEELRNAYLIPESSGWEEALHTLLGQQTEAFWAASYRVDPAGVAQAVDGAWRLLISAQAPLCPWPGCKGHARIEQRLADLNQLNGIDRRVWPNDLAVIAELFESDQGPIRPISIRPMDWDESLTPWQLAAIERVNRDAVGIDSSLEAELTGFEEQIERTRGPDGSRLRCVQERLGSGAEFWPDADASCDLLGVRDDLEGIEIAAGLVQERMRADPSLQPKDFGIVLPQGFEHAERMQGIFSRCGLPLSNLTGVVSERDLAHELLRFALMRFEGLAPSMAVQALVSNPLMPWPLETGRRLANTLTDFGFSLKVRHVESEPHRRVLALFEQAIPVERVGDAIAALLNALSPDPQLEQHRVRAKESGQKIIEALNQGERDWERLRALVPTQNFSAPIDQAANQEGICLIAEGRLPLRPVRQLLVLGFSEGHFPASFTPPAVFSPDEWRTLQAAGLPLQLSIQQSAIARRAFMRQIGHASDALTVLIPKLATTGSSLIPSAGLMDFALLAGVADKPESLVLDLEREEDRAQVAGLPIRSPRAAGRPKPIEAQDIRLETNLLAPHEVGGDKVRTLSPSTLDNLLVSPLAWLLRQLDAGPKTWAPDQFDPLTNGSIAHEVFEVLFPQESTDPDPDALLAQLDAAFERGVRQVSPFLGSAEWTVERDHLRGIVERAALSWAETMRQLRARLIQPEIDLKGHFDGVAIAGRADAVMDVPDVGAVVVDYKNARSDKFLTRMETGFDLQTVLYREMLKTGGPKEADGDSAQRLKDLQPTGVMYFAMQDGQAVADFAAPANLGNWRFAGREVSTQGLALLRQRFAELRRGEIRAPREAEVKAYKRSGVGLYALDMSPLTAVLHPDDGDAE